VLSVFVSAKEDVDIIIEKLEGTHPPPGDPEHDPRTVQQIYESLDDQKVNTLIDKAIEQKDLEQKLWQEIKTTDNKKRLIKVGLKNQRSKELIEVWEKLPNEHDFIIKKMDEVSENEEQVKEGFNKYTEEYIKKQDPGKSIEFEWKDLNRLYLDHHEGSSDPEHLIVHFDDGTDLFLPLEKLPDNLKKIKVNATGITYENNQGGKFIVEVKDVYPTTGGDSKKWVVKGFKDLAGNPYDVMIHFGTDGQAEIKAVKGGFYINKNAMVEIDDRYSKSYYLRNLDYYESAFVIIHNDGLYVFRGIIDTIFSANSGKFNFTEIAVDKNGVQTDLMGGSSARVSGYEKRFLIFNRDDEYSSNMLLNGNFDLVIGREIIMNSLGMDYELPTSRGEVHGGRIVKGNSLVLEHGFINAQRAIPGVSGVYRGYSRVGTTLSDIDGTRGSENGGKNFVDFFEDIIWVIDRIFGVKKSRTIVNQNGYFNS